MGITARKVRNLSLPNLFSGTAILRSREIFLTKAIFILFLFSVACGGAVGSTGGTAATPASLSFGSISVNTSTTATVTLTSTKKAAVQVQGFSIAGSTAFQVTNWTGKTTLPAGGSIQLNVKFTPTAASTYKGSLAIALSGSDLVVPLSGTGVTTSSNISVSVSPSSAAVQAGKSQQFLGTVTGTTNSSVTWKVNGIVGGNSSVGNITSAGDYTAPSSVLTTTSETITATSVADPTKSASAMVSVVPLSAPVVVSISPTSATVQTGATQQFSANVSGTTSTGVTWQVNGVTGGNATVGIISTGGLYSAPATIPSGSTVAVKAVSSYDNTASATSNVTIVAAPISVAISPTSATLQTNQARQFTASVSGTANVNVLWQVNGISGGNSTVGTVSTTGLYTAPATVPTSAVNVTATSAADSTKSATASLTITASSPPAAANFYGSGIGGDSLANTQVGGADCGCSGVGARSAYRFRASTSASLASIRIFFQDGTGYSGGNGGQIRVEVQTDDGSNYHRPSGSVMASTTVAPGNPVSNHWPQIAFASAPWLTAGQLYHIVFTNVDSSPSTNYMSVNGVYPSAQTVPMQPKFPDSDWAQLIDTGSFWSPRPITPVMQLNYSDGTVKGVGYMESWISSKQQISGTAQVAELITVTVPHSVSGAGVRVARVSGSSPLTIRLEDSSGNLIDKGTVSASAVGSGMTWVSASFSAAKTLNVGQVYRLVLAAPADTVYTTFPLRNGKAFGFGSATVFPDGYAQFNNGSGWIGWTMWGQTNRTDGDLQFYFLQ